MSTAPRDLISASLRLLGVLASGEALGASEATDGLASLNRMIDTWSNEGLLIYATTEEAPITLVGGTGAYTLGVGGNLTTRPQAIVKAVVRSNSIDYPVDILTTEQYAEIPNKTIQSNFPSCLYDDGGYPQRTIKLFPVPSTANSLILWTERALSRFATISSPIDLPPGYEDGLIHNLAIRLAPEYGRQPSQSIIEIAANVRADIKRKNYKPKALEIDSALVGHGHFNIFTGGYTR